MPAGAQGASKLPRVVLLAAVLALGTAAQHPQAALRTAVLQALIADPEVGQYPLAASVDANGHVALDGALPNKADKRRAAQVAKRVAGVHGVDNHITINPAVRPLAGAGAAPARAAEAVEPATAASGADVQAVILNALAAKPELRRVTVAVSGGTVRLGGEVDSPRARREAAAIAQTAAGGRKLDNRIRVRE